MDRVLLPRTKVAAHPPWLGSGGGSADFGTALALGLADGTERCVCTGIADLGGLAWRHCVRRGRLCTASRFPRRAVTAQLALAVGYLVLLFAVQQPFLAGAAQCADAVRLCLNTRFNANFVVSASPVSAQMGLFALLTAVPFTMFWPR